MKKLTTQQRIGLSHLALHILTSEPSIVAEVASHEDCNMEDVTCIDISDFLRECTKAGNIVCKDHGNGWEITWFDVAEWDIDHDYQVTVVRNFDDMDL